MLKREAPIYWENNVKAPNAQVTGRDPQKNWKPDIYGKFIWTDANLFPHRGISTAGQSRMVALPSVSARACAAGEILKPLPPSPPPPAAITHCHMNTEPYKDQDPGNVADEAIAWLEEQFKIAES
jgi:hypothetical protein